MRKNDFVEGVRPRVSLYNERFQWVTSYPFLVYFTYVLCGLLRLSLFLNI